MTTARLVSPTYGASRTLRRRIGRGAWECWRAYWDWRSRRATVKILSSLDNRTLKDIGLSYSEIESTVYGPPDERVRGYHHAWAAKGRI